MLVGKTGLYKIVASLLFVRVARYQLYVIMVVSPVTHCAHIYALAAVNLFNYYHQPFCKTDYLVVDIVGRFAHVVIMLDSRNARVPHCSWVADQKTFYIFILVNKLILVVAKNCVVVFPVEAGRTYPKVGKLCRG